MRTINFFTLVEKWKSYIVNFVSITFKSKDLATVPSIASSLVVSSGFPDRPFPFAVQKFLFGKNNKQ